MVEERNIIPDQMVPKKKIQEVKGSDGNDYLLRNEVMFTAYQHSAGEFSEFFITLRNQCKILGKRCPTCNQLLCPPFEKKCQICNFEVEMQSEEMADIGTMAASPVIVFFAPARFKDQVPFGIGYVFLEDKDGHEADTAIMVRVRTTHGMIKPGIFKKGTKVKVVFRNERQGEMLDVFVVPQCELTPEQIQKTPFLENDISWDASKEPSFAEPSEDKILTFRQVLEGFDNLSLRVKESKRAQADLANWMRTVKIKTGGGTFGFKIDNGKLEMLKDEFQPDLVLAIDDPSLILAWLERGAALTNLVMEGTLWVSKSELETITRLDRIPRSLRRDNC